MAGVAYILGTLTDEDIDWLVTTGVRRSLAPGERIIREGTPATALFFVLEGALTLSGSDPAQPQERMSQGDVVGEIGLLDGGPAPVTIEADGASTVLELPFAQLTAQLESDGGFAARFYRAMAVMAGERYREERFGDSGGGDTAAPIAHGINTYLADDRMHRLLRRADPREEIVLSGGELTVEQVARVAWTHAPVSITESAAERLHLSRAVVDRLAGGEEPVYGLTTNLGALKDQRLSDEQQPLFQKHVLLSHSVGVGVEHPEDVVRAIMLARLNGMARGGAGVQPAVFEALLAMLNAGVHPAVPSRGSIGMSDLAPLAHMALPLVGHGEVFFKGQRLSGAEGLAAAGISAPPLGPKDGLALVSANSASVGHGALVITRAIDLLAIADVAAALSLEALGGHTTMLDQGVDTARRFSGQLTSAQHMRMLLEESSLWTAPPTLGVQDPISFRSAIQVHGAVLDSLALVRSTLETELNSTGDNPMVLADRGEIISDGNFHPAGLSIAFDTLAIALAQLTSMATNRIVRLMDPKFTHLPPYLAPNPDQNVGLGVIQKTATALNAEVRMAANPASLDYVPVAGSIEDHATMAVEGVAKAGRAVDAALDIFAIEMLVAAQAIDLREGVTLGIGTRAAYGQLRERVALMETDRLVAHDIAEVRGLLDCGAILRAASEAISIPLGTSVRPGGS
ncbi:MAG: aromatic amino acid lyase [Thermoleophilia bacterium]|nr:aromatic amino acid lyase [Thermoleophilia bacterium]